jgi:hypothetical protein
MAFGAKAVANQGKTPKPPLPRAQNQVEGFDKKEWIREFRLMKKDIAMDERDKYRPLMCLKHEF